MIKRSILPVIEEHLSVPEMTILTGPRQVGKTYLMRVLEERLKEKGEKTLYLNLDYDDDRPIFASQGTLLDYIRLKTGETKAYLFIDEIQRKENAGLFLKGLYDMKLPYKFILSGSGSLELKAKIVESMAGRKRFFTIDPLSFEEFVNFKTGYRYQDKLNDFFTIEKRQTLSLLEEFTVYGGYPRIVLADTADKKAIEMEDIYTSYIKRDIRDLLYVEKPEAFTNLVKIMASQIGSLVNTTELSQTIGIADKTVRHYLWYLEQTFIIKKITPYYQNVRNEIVKSPIYYFYDTGLRNYMLGLFGLPVLPSLLAGHLFENIIWRGLRQNIPISPITIHFWRTRDHAEVDFVLQVGLDTIPIEVKHRVLTSTKISRSFQSFLIKYKPKDAYIIHLGEYLQSTFEGTTIHFLPFYDLQKVFDAIKSWHSSS